MVLGRVADTSEAFQWSVNKLASALNVDRRTISKRIAEAGIDPCGARQGHPVYLLSDVARVVFNPSLGAAGPEDLDKFPEQRKAWYQSENERIKFETSVGQLIHQSVFVRETSLVIKNMVNSLDSLPDQMERDFGLAPKVVASVQKAIDAAREQAYHAVVKATGKDE